MPRDREFVVVSALGSSSKEPDIQVSYTARVEVPSLLTKKSQNVRSMEWPAQIPASGIQTQDTRCSGRFKFETATSSSCQQTI
jgi:hypothetical protein